MKYCFNIFSKKLKKLELIYEEKNEIIRI